MKVALDLDGVLYDFVGGILFRLRDKWDIAKNREDFKFPLRGLTGNPIVDIDIHQQIFSPRMYHDLSVISGAQDAVDNLARVAEVHAITARPMSTRAVTLLRVNQDFPGIVKIHYTSRKARLARALRIKYAVEDHGPTVEEYSGRRIRVWMVMHPYSSEVKPNRLITKVNSICEASSDILRQCSKFREV